ncbi:GNAT family N-acetyltransferase [Pseudobacteriovorax antillogorgiicola]|uniref:Peptidogalycan biosysnthesis/recognition n=1 Tax=Pseudobacteriovorax antillogorgiicola TaxID=1513793 RepID=A0A1Y6B888_9BACT|nr:GNAT family N-acetyltransferase [Pseudobacteriovorax antillogorgiicola]TCS58520.1 hypothetical protein EDD56_10233 [Pseudobacteriovorax antillogorgiicola]SME98017.1 hypothetical protein SAMN06296036_102410 [Pseudobacteriovorax antillogorgiicola]
MEIRIVKSMSKIERDDWKPLESRNFPFTDYDFLASLERSGSLGERTGWFPHFFAAYVDHRLIGALIAYLKTNSYGEYIFDWEWANGFHHHQIPYYPKLTSSIPFTPATGTKLLLHSDYDQKEIREEVDKALLSLVKSSSCSSIHHLFIPQDELQAWQGSGYHLRYSQQYHWHNHAYQCFDDFLAKLKGKRAKEVRRERRQIAEQGVAIELLTGDSLDQMASDRFYQFYLATLDKKHGLDYLTQEFFRLVFQSMQDRIVLCVASYEGDWVAASLSFQKGDHLYGRYWGSTASFRSLHFELCYYQMIDYAIAKGLKLFEAGAQGRHKIQRGFVPSWTYSAHKIFHPAFDRAIAEYIREEKRILDQAMEEDQNRSPYRPFISEKSPC